MDRGEVLDTAKNLTTGDRNRAYGDPSINLTCAGELKQIYQTYAQNKYSLAHDEAIEQLLTKIARIATGNFKTDNYVDASAYAAIACEVEAKIWPKPLRSEDIIIQSKKDLNQ